MNCNIIPGANYMYEHKQDRVKKTIIIAVEK